MGRPARVQDGRHLRGRVRGRDAVLLQHLRAGERGAAAARREGARHRQRADPHRPGDRVRLLGRPRRLGAPGGRRRGDHGELQPRDRLDRLRHERPPLLRAAGRRGRARPPRQRDATTAPARPRSCSSAARRRSTSRCPSRAPTSRSSGSSAEAIDLAEDRRRSRNSSSGSASRSRPARLS